MPISKEQKTATIVDNATFEGDTGSTAVQIALLTQRINALSTHLTANKKDKHGQRGLQILVGKRGRLTKYLKNTDFEAYRALIEKLGLRR
ncbi:MAG TPA: 30S ribosomal protein S15 [Deinococcales bacterium]|nr:30S ribosomal protein S15 [Deinococcales bacterium]